MINEINSSFNPWSVPKENLLTFFSQNWIHPKITLPNKINANSRIELRKSKASQENILINIRCWKNYTSTNWSHPNECSILGGLAMLILKKIQKGKVCVLHFMHSKNKIRSFPRKYSHNIHWSKHYTSTNWSHPNECSIPRALSMLIFTTI